MSQSLEQAAQIQSPDFNTYNLCDMPSRGVYGLADGLIPDIAKATGFEIAEYPTEQALRALTKHVGHAKTLQDNIGLMTARLRVSQETTAVQVTAGWAERSGAMKLLDRSFVSPEIALPEEYQQGLIMGGVLRWIDRRGEEALELAGAGRLKRVDVVVGQRLMGAPEAAWVKAFIRNKGVQPTEAQYAESVLMPKLLSAGMEAQFTEVNSKEGADIALAAAQKLDLTKNVVVISNAPNGPQATGEFRLAAREVAGKGFDESGEQLFMRADSRLLALNGESPATHQNTLTVPGQIMRDALLMYLNQHRIK